MTHAQKRWPTIGLYALISTGFALGSATCVFAVQAPYELPATHERQCVPTGQIPPGDARTITVTWKHPFATGEYDIVGSVAEPGENRQAIELGHIVIPHSPTAAAAVVFNRDTSAAQSGVLCLDASTP